MGSADRYHIGGLLGQGGMGEVLAARDGQIGREVAIKRLKGKSPSTRQVDRFLREACIQGRLDHPAIVPVHELGRDADGLPFFAMKKLAGTTLSEILIGADRERFPRQRLLRAFADVCLAIEYAHVHGVIHRDLKPANIVLGDFGEVYVLDWGVAKVIGETDDFEDVRSAGTISGAVVGTPAYMPPEQASGGVVDARADVFALGRVLAEILGRDAEPPPELMRVAARAEAVALADRIQSARELGGEVERYLDGDRDLGLRRKLSADHLARATEALTVGEGAARATAIREAGTALALDPHSRAAAELVSRLMLEPPREVPPAVHQLVAADDRRLVREHAWAILLSHLGYLALLPSLIAMGLSVTTLLVCAVAATTFFLAIIEVRGNRVYPPWILIAGNAAMVPLLCRMFSPVLIAPAFAAMVALTICLNPFVNRRWHVGFLFVSFAGGIIAWLAAEQLGWIPSTMSLENGHVDLHAPGILAEPAYNIGLAMMYMLVIIGAGIGLGRVIQRSDRQVRAQLQLQTWQLRQLVSNVERA
jgi:hypothetical protein